MRLSDLKYALKTWTVYLNDDGTTRPITLFFDQFTGETYEGKSYAQYPLDHAMKYWAHALAFRYLAATGKRHHWYDLMEDKNHKVVLRQNWRIH